jgi:hypothetical protein
MISRRLATLVSKRGLTAIGKNSEHLGKLLPASIRLSRAFSSKDGHHNPQSAGHVHKGKEAQVEGGDCSQPAFDKDGKPHVHGPDCNHDHHEDGHVHGPDCNHDHDHHHHQPAEEDNDPVLKSITEFKSALDLLEKGDLVQGYARLKQVKEILENVKLHQTIAYFRLLRK